ncbi:MAG TPA: UvrD-helicase domain-containing protein, partial [Luteitalea sp.]|nr:UvrD-helicase domain-containing protein [Luteitalea sp.]
MTFLIADTFTDSLGRLTGEEQKAAKTTAFDLQMDASAPGLSYHKLDKAKDKRFWSVRVNADIRLIVHRTDSSLLLCYVDHHDRAYAWAERRKLETHPTTGAAQIVEIREAVREIVVPTYVQSPVGAHTPRRPLRDVSEQLLLEYGVPPEWVTDARQADEDGLLTLAAHLPAEAAEAILELATGGTPSVAPPLPSSAAASTDSFAHPDAQRRFRVVASVEELAAALDAPWDKWAVFLHPEQRSLVERDYNGPARVAGSAGTGKTIVALHRAAHLARTMPDARVLLATFSEPLAHALRVNLRRLVGTTPRVGERLEVHALDSLAVRLHQSQIGPVRLVSQAELDGTLDDATARASAHGFSRSFVRAEWDQVVDAWHLRTWEAYRDVPRLGRRSRLPEARRAVLWSIFEAMIAALRTRGSMTRSELFHALAATPSIRSAPPFDVAVIDEAQDLDIAQLRFLAALGGNRRNALFFAGDLGQRIFQQPFSWKALGVDVRGRSKTLHVNYRTSHQIRQH